MSSTIKKMKIKKVVIEGFRAYKYRKDGIFDFTLDDDSPSNFVALYAPNGFGKSSFYDAVEWAFTANLDRYTAEHNKKNNHSAARGTKQDQVPMKILRNKYVPDSVVTQVDVITTRGDFVRALPKLRSNSTDLDLKSTKTKKEGKGFEKIILSQDAIDRFLREAKPQERYQLFMQYFGGEAEALRIEITAVLNENKITLDGLQKKKTDITKLLKKPVDSTIFERFNVVAENLNRDGEAIPLVTEIFDSSTEYKLLSFITERKHALSSDFNTEREKERSLLEQASRLEEFQLNLSLLSEQNPRFELLSKGVADAQQYQRLSDVHDKSLQDWQKGSALLKELDTIKSFIPEFLVEQIKLREVEEERGTLIKEKTNVQVALDIAHGNVKQFKNALTMSDEKALSLRTLLAGSSAVYSDLAVSQSILDKLNAELKSKLTSVATDKAERSRAVVTFEKLSTLLINVETLKGPDSVHFGLSLSRLQELYSAQHELELLQQHDSVIRKTQVALTRQKKAIELLVSQGLTYLADWQSDSCPLCRVSHTSSEALTSAIRNNDLLTDAEKQSAIQLEQIAARLKSLKGIVDAVLSEAKVKLSKVLVNLQTQLSQLSLRINSTEQESHSLSTKISSTQQTISDLQTRVWRLESPDLHVRVEAELALLSNSSSVQRDQLALANKQLVGVELKLNRINKRLEALRLIVESITTRPPYRAVEAFASKEAIRDYERLLDHCVQKRASLEDAQEKRKNKIYESDEQRRNLQQAMLVAGNWIDFELLDSQKSSVSDSILDAKFFIDSYLGGVSSLLGSDVESDPDLIKSKIEVAIQGVSKKSTYLAMKIEKIELLIVQLSAFKPYLESLVLRDRLAEIDKKTKEHQLVDSKLSADRELVFAELRERVGAFFFSDLINGIYSKIDPHPSFKEVDFVPDFDSAQPGLNIVLRDETGDVMSPMLYFSAAQLNILSLSIFIANALHAKDDKGNSLDVILIDDPIQSMDSINILAVIDLLRNISLRFNKQIIISTHDENFFELLKLKIPTEIFGSKFIQLESFGIVSRAQSSKDFFEGSPKPSITNEGLIR